jgi:sulfatase maturation enzyme AslB (radical SAM superfamily)
VESPEDLPSKLDAALQRHDWPAHQTNARTFITWMMDQVLVGCTPEVPARRNLQDLAKFIARTAIDARSLPSAPARCQQAEQSLPWLRRVSAAGSALPTNTVSPAAATQSPEPAAPAVVADRRTVEFVDQATRQIVGGIRDFNDVPELWDAIAQLPSSANRAIYELCTAALANARPARSSRENHAQAILASLAGYHAGIKSLDELRAVSDKLLLVESQSALISGFHFRVVKLADPENPILKLENFVCQMPFVELDILSATSHLCCASWLQKSAGNMAAQDYPEVWNSPAAQAIRQSVLDGSYRYCNKNACPLIMQGKLDKKEVMLKDPWWADVIKNGKGVIDRPPKMVNLAYDSHCNLHCPSCRSSVITTNDSEREKLDAITQRNVYPLLATAESVYVTGSGDPFASKTFRKLLGWISHETCPKLKVRLMTNGLLFTEKEWARFPNLKGKIRCVRVSVDGATKETHELLRRGSRWETMMENLPFIGALLKQGEIDAYDLVFVVQRDNYREMGDFVDLAMRVGANRACFERITNWGTFSPEQFQHKAVFNSGHPEFPEFVKVMQDKRLSGPNVFIGSFAPFLPS